MSPDQITPILQRLQDTNPLDPDPAYEGAEKYRDWYIENLHPVYADVVKLLSLEVQDSIGSRHAYLFSGTIGSGKSTELRRLAYGLKQKGHHAVVVNIMDYLNPQMAVGVTDLLMAIALGAWESSAKARNIDANAGERFAWWTSLLRARPEGKELEINGGPVKMKFALQANPVYRERLRQFFASSLDELVRETNKFMAELADNIRTDLRLAKDAKCLLVIDSLEHFGGFALAGQSDEVLKSLLEVFNTFNRYLRLDGWSLVYSVPPLLQKLAPGLAATFGSTNTYYLTSAHVFNDRSDSVDDTTVDNKLVPLTLRRLDCEENLLFAPGVLRDVVVKTGGDLRDLLRTLRSVLLMGVADNAFPVTMVQLERVYNNLRRPYLPLPLDTAVRLRHVRLKKEPMLASADDWPSVMSDLAAKRVLLYLNGVEWYDVHPLLRDVVDSNTPPVVVPG